MTLWGVIPINERENISKILEKVIIMKNEFPLLSVHSDYSA